MESSELSLRYLNAAQVDTPLGKLADLVLLSPTDEALGHVSGVVIDPAEREVCYFIVESRQWLKTRRYLLPLAQARMDAGRKALHLELEADDLHRLPEVQADTFPFFSDDDLISALFSSHAA